MTSGLDIIKELRWIDGRPFRDLVEPYRWRIYEAAFAREPSGRLRYDLGVDGRAKKNWKTCDLVMQSIGCMMEDSPHGNECYLFANDEDQAADDLTLAKKIVAANPALSARLVVRDKAISRVDGNGFLKILPAMDVKGSHGKTYRRASFDEIHGYRNWDLFEAMQKDPTRLDAQMWITSYASIYHKPGVPLFDLCAMGRAGRDPRLFFSWYAADYTTDPDFATATPEQRANPSAASWSDATYLAQQQRRLPAHKFRRLHLNLPGLPEGSAFQPEPVMNAIARGAAQLDLTTCTRKRAFVDMSGGSNDDAVLAIGGLDADGRAIIGRVENQGPPPPFDPRLAVERFATLLHEEGIATVEGDKYAGETFRADFERHGITHRVAGKTASQLYEALSPYLNGSRVRLPDVPQLEQQLLGLVWRGGKIDHAGGEHDDASNAVAGCVHALLSSDAAPLAFYSGGRTISAAPRPVPLMETEEDHSLVEQIGTAVASAVDAVTTTLKATTKALGKAMRPSPARPAPVSVRRKSFEEMAMMMRQDLSEEEQRAFDQEVARRAKHRTPSALEQLVRRRGYWGPEDGLNKADPGDLNAVMDAVRATFARW